VNPRHDYIASRCFSLPIENENIRILQDLTGTVCSKIYSRETGAGSINDEISICSVLK